MSNTLDALPQGIVCDLFLDESEFEIKRTTEKSYIYSSGLAVVEGSDSIGKLEESYQELIFSLRNDESFALQKVAYNRVLNEGFHLVEDNLELSIKFLDFIVRQPSVKYHFRYFHSGRKLVGTEKDKIYSILHASNLKPVISRYKYLDQLNFRFEQYEALNSKYEQLVSYCYLSLGRQNMGRGTVTIEKKGQYPAMAMVDYFTLVSARMLAKHLSICDGDVTCAGGCPIYYTKPVDEVSSHIGVQHAECRNFAKFHRTISSFHEIGLHPGVLG